MRAENRDGFHSVCSVNELRGREDARRGVGVVSRKTVSRISRYRRLLSALHDDGVESIYSHQLARHAVVSAAQVRRDLMVIGYSGSPNRATTSRPASPASAASSTGQPARTSLSSAWATSATPCSPTSSARARRCAIVAAFDVDSGLIDTVVHGCRCFSVTHMESLVRDLGIEIAVLTVPGPRAQAAADTLVRAGVRSLISFAPVALHLPDDIFVEYMDITAALESAAYFARPGARAGAEAAADSAIEPMVKELESLLSRSHMKLEDLARDIGARIVTPGKAGGTEVARIYAGDRVSDLLNQASDKTLLVSNLASVQMLRVAELMDVPGICFVSGVQPDDEMVRLATENDTLMMVSPAGVFETCGLIYRFLGGETLGLAHGAPRLRYPG